MIRVLIVEDSPTQAEQLRLILVSEGYDVEVSFDGEQGLKLVGASNFDLVVSDILMPGISGYELCRRLKADPGKRNIPVILLTTLSDPMDIIQGLECGADNFITKPYEPAHLVERIKNILESRRLRGDGKLRVGVEVMFLGKKLMITSDKQQILDLLISTFEDVVRTNRELQASKARLADATAQIAQHANRMETMAIESAEKYRIFMEKANDAIWIAEDDGSVIEVNHQMEVLLGRPAAEIIGRRIHDFVIPSQVELAEELREKLRAEGRMRFGALFLQRSDGRTVQVDVSVSIVEIGGERLCFAIFRDIAEQKQLEEQLRQAQKMEAIGRLAGGVAHDFNNLLTAILGYSHVVETELGEGHPLLAEVEQIRKAGERAASLTRQLLAFSRKQVLVPEVLNLNSVVTEIDRMLRRVIGEDLELRTVLDHDLGHVLIDPTQVEQVLMNLCVNSRDAMPAGGKLTIETNNVELDESYCREHVGVTAGPYVMLAVSDTGVGMDAETRSHIFEPFFTTKGSGKGTGLGLSTVYGIVKQSQGNVEVYSEPGKGTTLKIYLPRVDKEAEVPAVAARKAAKERGGTETVLVVEDDEAIRRLVGQFLSLRGYHVILHANALDALHAAAQHTDPIGLLLTDVVLPGLSGPELASRVAKMHPWLKVLYMSGYTDEAIMDHGLIEPGTAFLQKPFTPDALVGKVRAVLDEK
ncbi:MAG: response regulator [Acidobacteria bacterium]|nr:response regulator [Acidobacteriota bacterium]